MSMLLLACALPLSGCERAPRPDPGRWTKVKAEDVPEGVDKSVEFKTVKFDVGLPETPEHLKGHGRPEIDPLPTEVAHGRCDEPDRAKEAQALEVRATGAKGGKLTVTLTGYGYYCSPKPNFAAGMEREHGIVVAEVAPPPDTPMSRCTCLHDVTINVENVPPGEHELRVFSRLGQDGDPVPEAMTTVKMPG